MSNCANIDLLTEIILRALCVERRYNSERFSDEVLRVLNQRPFSAFTLFVPGHPPRCLDLYVDQTELPDTLRGFAGGRILFTSTLVTKPVKNFANLQRIRYTLETVSDCCKRAADQAGLDLCTSKHVVEKILERLSNKQELRAA